jgi:hypothetical protein
MRIVKTAVKSFNPAKFLEDVGALGVTSISWVGFFTVSDRQMDPNAIRQTYGSTVIDGVRTRLLADPGEMHLEAPSDPGAALDTAITDHDFTVLTAEQTTKDATEADRVTLQAGLDGGGNLNQDEIKAMARVVLNS